MSTYEKRPYLKSETADLLDDIEEYLEFTDEDDVSFTRFQNANGRVTQDRIIRAALRDLRNDILPGADGT